MTGNVVKCDDIASFMLKKKGAIANMKKTLTAVWCAISILVLTVLPSCTLFRGRQPSDSRRPPQGEFVTPGSDMEQALRATVQKQLQAADSVSVQTPPQNARLIYSRPYYYKEVAVYPNKEFDVEMRETDSLTEPYAAIVRVEKVLFVTEMKRKRADAEADNHFLRQTGVETLYYRFKNGRWINSGSRFESEKTEEFAGGQWTPVQEKKTEVFAKGQKEQGVLGRIWSTVFGK